MTGRPSMDCATADELAAAFGLGALATDEERAVADHLDSCAEPHLEAHSLIDAATLMPESLEPLAPSEGLRERLMATVAVTPQDHRPVSTPASRVTYVEPAPQPRHPWWQWGPLPGAIAAVGLVAAVGLGAWGVTLNTQLAERDTALRAFASADAVYAAQGEAGRGWVLQAGETAYFVSDDLAELAAGQLYELWLIDGAGNAVAAGMLTDTDGVALVALDQGLGTATTFAITVETQRVEQPSGAPVIVAPLEG